MALEFNITFGNKQFLIFFALIPLIVFLHFYFLRHSKKRALKFGNFNAMRRVQGHNIVSKNLTPLFFLLIIVTLLIFALSQATFWFKTSVSSTDYMILLDSGASMNARDLTPDRYTIAKQIAVDLVTDLQGSKIGFLSFGGTMLEHSAPTTDKTKLLNLIENAKISNTGTDLGQALIFGAEQFRDSNNSRVIILLSDGHDTVGIPLATGLNVAQEEHVKIFSVGIGSVEGGNFLNVPESQGLISKLNEKNLQTLSNATQSQYININSVETMGLATSMLRVDVQEGYVRYETTATLLILVITIIFFEWVLHNTRFRIFP
ncbi:VWA domain-containing protein [Candidatus Woesearchaeota archaeon]|nr:VWA domain-containing protein [Candidatus Woesearchaeota archaeon]